MIYTESDIRKAMIRLGDDYIAHVWNEWCEEQHYYDDEIFSMDDFDELLSEKEPSEIARTVVYGDFSPNDSYFTFDGYGNLYSFDLIGLSGTRISERAETYFSFDEMFEAIYHGEFLPDIAKELLGEKVTA